MKENQYIEKLINDFDEKMEKESFTDDDLRTIASAITDRQTFSEGLPMLLKKSNEMKEAISGCDSNIKIWQSSKKFWTERQGKFMKLLELIMSGLNVPGMKIASEGVKLSVSRRTALEVDEDWIISQYTSLAESLQANLPVFIKVKLDVNKNELAAYLKEDDSLLVNHPDRIHTKVTTSTTIK